MIDRLRSIRFSQIGTLVFEMLVALILAACGGKGGTAPFPEPATASSVPPGNYYLDGDIDESNAYIQIINHNTMRLINFDVDFLARYLIEEWAGYTGDEAAAFMERHNLPQIFHDDIEFEFNATDNFIYLKVLSNGNEPPEGFLVPNYRMTYEGGDVILFLGDVYIRR